MTHRPHLPIRLRLTLIFAAAMAVVIAAVSVFVYLRLSADLLATVDAGIRSRAQVLAADVREKGPDLAGVDSRLIESDEAFEQIADSSGRIIESSPIVAGHPLLPPDVIRRTESTGTYDQRIPGIDDFSRIIVLPVNAPDGRYFVLAGAALQDRHDALVGLATILAVGGPAALLLASIVGWLVAGAALRPVERLRSEAAAISESGPGRRLSVAGDRDEIERLGTTLNEMLDRIEAGVERERRFLDDASHELRTPVAILKGELDLALARARTPEELKAALRSAADEADHLATLADGLLVLSRTGDGPAALQREEISLADLVEEAARHARPAAERHGLHLEAAGENATVSLDPVAVRRALDNLMLNAIRHTPEGGTVALSASRRNGVVLAVVEDSGPGFPDEFLSQAFEPFMRTGRGAGAGLGLAIVQSIALAHGGEARAENLPDGGARVSVTFPAGD